MVEVRIRELEERVSELEKHIYHLTCKVWSSDFFTTTPFRYNPNYDTKFLTNAGATNASNQ